MLTFEQHLDNLVRHLELVHEAGLLLGKKLIAQGRHHFGRMLIQNVFMHDVSKFAGIEWEFLHAGKDVPQDKLALAMKQHCETNDHHPERWGGVENMSELSVAEMVCDWYARSQELGTGLRDWIQEKALEKYNIQTNSEPYLWITKYVDLLLENEFKPEETLET